MVKEIHRTREKKKLMNVTLERWNSNAVATVDKMWNKICTSSSQIATIYVHE
jgi:hypothetical protein